MSIGLCIGEFAPLHQGHLDLIMRAKKDNSRCLVAVCNYAGSQVETDFGLGLRRRTQLVRELFMNDSHVSVLGIENRGAAPDAEYRSPFWKDWFAELRNRMCLSTDELVVYVSDQAVEANLLAMGVRTYYVKPDLPYTEAQVREHPLRYWNQISRTFQPFMTKNILVIGTASEGKTTLVNDIAAYFNIPRAEEWGRVYMEQHALADEDLDVSDFVEFITGQLHLYQEAVAKASRGITISDTDNLVTLMYALAYVKDTNIALSEQDYQQVLKPLAWSLRHQFQWERIFVMIPGGEYVDDGFRYMGQSSMEERTSNHQLLMSLLEEFGLSSRVTFMQGGRYLENFEMLKSYVNELLAQ